MTHSWENPNTLSAKRHTRCKRSPRLAECLRRTTRVYGYLVAVTTHCTAAIEERAQRRVSRVYMLRDSVCVYVCVCVCVCVCARVCACVRCNRNCTKQSEAFVLNGMCVCVCVYMCVYVCVLAYRRAETHACPGWAFSQVRFMVKI